MEKDTMIFHELFNILVFQFKVVTVEYFMDKMTEWEINDIMDNLPYLDRNLWETCRLNTYINMRMNTTKELELTDIIKFKWDDVSNNTDKGGIEISNEDIQRLKEKAKHLKI